MRTADKQILFACTQNAVRSVIAKGLFETKSYSSAGRAVSCGVIEGPLDGFVVAVLQERALMSANTNLRFLRHLIQLILILLCLFPVKQKTKPADGLMGDVKLYSGMSPRHI